MSLLKRLLAWFRPDTSRPLTQAWLAALWMGVLANWPLWKQLQSLPEISGVRGAVFTLAFAGMVTAATGALLSLLAWPRFIKGLLLVLLLTSGALAYFIGSYGIVFDPTMVTNMLQTDARETRDLLSWRLLVSLLMLPADSSVAYLFNSRSAGTPPLTDPVAPRPVLTITAVPEPGTAVFGICTMIVGTVRRRRRNP